MKRALGGYENRGLTIVEVLVVIATLGIIAMIILARPPHDRSIRINCTSNLKQVGIAFRVWEGDNGDHYPMTISTKKDGTMEYAGGSNFFRHFQVMSNELNNPIVLICPQDSRKPADDFTNMSNANISYFVGLDADETWPAMPLAGDRKLLTNGVAVKPGLLVFGVTNAVSIAWQVKMHNGAGNVALADGSVQQFSSAALQQMLQNSGTNVIRLGVP
jgi:prepilin-type N-terminal cleavage/methylation domain-containing protein/prepilin-type processing-associated H-X9-DG protein